MARRSLDLLPESLTPCPLAAEFQEPVSHCRVCGRDVLDLSRFTREEAAHILSTTEPPCVRFTVSDGKPLFAKTAKAVALAALVGGAVAAREAANRPPPPPARGLDFTLVGGVPRRASWK